MTPKGRTTAVQVSDELLRDGASDVEAMPAGLFVAVGRDGREATAELLPPDPPDPPAPDHVAGDARECRDRCGALTETATFESRKGPLAICSECRSDAAMEE